MPNSGNVTNGLVQAGQGIPLATYLQPALGVAPRFGMAYDLTGRQQIVLRGGGGLYFDRPSGNAVFAQVLNPPARKSVTLRFGQLQTLGTAASPPRRRRRSGSTSTTARCPRRGSGMPACRSRCRGAPWWTCPYVGQHGYNIVEGINLNADRLRHRVPGQNQDPTLAPTTPGATSLASDQMRAFRGYSGITQNVSRGWVTHHSLQLSFNRRFRNGLSFGFNDTIGLSSRGSSARACSTIPMGRSRTAPTRPRPTRLFQTPPTRHTMKGNFVWDLPDLRATAPALRAIGLVINDWQFSGVWTASTAGTVHRRLQLPERRRQR